MTNFGCSIRITHCYRRLWRTADLAADREDLARIVQAIIDCCGTITKALQAMIDRGFISSVAGSLEAARRSAVI
jgi:hypothetical protein